MYLIEYKLPLLSLMYLVKIAQIKTLIFLFWDKDLDKKKSTTFGFALGQNFRWVAFHIRGITLSSNSYSLYA